MPLASHVLTEELGMPTKEPRLRQTATGCDQLVDALG